MDMWSASATYTRKKPVSRERRRRSEWAVGVSAAATHAMEHTNVRAKTRSREHVPRSIACMRALRIDLPRNAAAQCMPLNTLSLFECRLERALLCPSPHAWASLLATVWGRGGLSASQMGEFRGAALGAHLHRAPVPARRVRVLPHRRDLSHTPQDVTETASGQPPPARRASAPSCSRRPDPPPSSRGRLAQTRSYRRVSDTVPDVSWTRPARAELRPVSLVAESVPAAASSLALGRAR